MSHVIYEDKSGKKYDLIQPLPEKPVFGEDFNFIYTILKDELPALDTFGAPRKLVFAIGEKEIEVEYDECKGFSFKLEDIGKITAEDLLTLKLYQKGDETNVLWEAVLAGEIKLELKDGDTIVKADSKGNYYVFIEETPSMPKLSAKIKPDGLSGTVKWQLKIEYERPNRKDKDIFPLSNKSLPASNSWDIFKEFENKIIGGKATLTWEWLEKAPQKEFVFYIKGKNPTWDNIKAFVDNAQNIPWFLLRLIKHESKGAKQFEESGILGPNWINIKNTPILGHVPDKPNDWGWGLMQINDKYWKSNYTTKV
ncbi:MAG: hypothetical protein HQK79_23235 [Desulfobacterales bacterium]|nr:hypothetical protein [Desulfobacterales bacterium]